jgi:hypothetical protein
MSRYLYGETNPVSAGIQTGDAISVGDLVGYGMGNVYKASATTWDTNLATTQIAFGQTFLGVSGQKKLAGESRVHGNSTDNIIRVDCSGVYEFSCVNASYEIGQWIGAAKDSGNALLNDTVAGVSCKAEAIGICVEATTGTKIKIQLLSTKNPVAK